MPNIRTSRNLSALTLVEFIVVIGVVAVLSGVSLTLLNNYFFTTIVATEADILIAELRKAKQLAVGNDGSNPYSVRFFSGRYVSFPGTNYSASNPDNFEVELSDNITLTDTFTGNQLIFENQTGRPTESGTITLSGTQGTSIQITINSLGVIER